MMKMPNRISTKCFLALGLVTCLCWYDHGLSAAELTGPQSGGIQQVNWNQSPYPPPSYYATQGGYIPMSYGQPPAYPPGVNALDGYPPPGVEYEYSDCEHTAVEVQTPYDQGLDYDSPLDELIMGVVHQSWIRFEYLNWEMEAPGNVLLGSPILGVAQPRNLFPVFAGGVNIGNARVHDLSDIGHDHLNGIRGTLGVPFLIGDFEMSFFGLDKNRETSVARDLQGNAPFGSADFIATSTYVNGALGDNQELYDVSFEASHTTRVWGAEGNIILTPYIPGPGLKLMPIFGIRYFNLNEELNQVGVFDAGGTITPITTTIDADADNNFIGPTFGLRAELRHPWFSLSVEPKITPAWNSYDVSVTAENFRAAVDPAVYSSESDTVFGAVAELGINARVRISDNFWLTVGYTLLWADQVVRPEQSIYYNDNGALPTPIGIRARRHLDDIVTQGLTVGAEFRFK